MGSLWSNVILLLFIFHPISAVSLNPIETNQNLAKCLLNMIRNDILETSIKNIQINIEATSKSEIWEFGEIVNQLLHSNDFDAMFYINNRNAETNFKFPIHRRILFVDSFKSFKLLIRSQRSHAINVSGLLQYFYIILPSNVIELELVLQQILKFSLDNMIADVNIISENGQEVVTIYSYYPFTPTSCKNSKPIIYNHFRNGSFKWRKPVFPQKLLNLWQCPLTVILWDEPPFVGNLNQPDNVLGVDKHVLDFLAENMNVTLKIVNILSGPGEIYPNGTMTKGFKMLNDGNGDLMLSGTALNYKRSLHFAATDTYFGVSIQLIFKPPEKYDALSVLLFPFDKFTWLAISLVLFGIRILWKKFSLKLLMPVWLFSALIFQSSYEGSIYKFLHDHPSKKLPQNLDEAIADGYTFIVRQSFFNVYGQRLLMEIERSRILVFDVNMDGIFKIFSKLNGKYALISNREYLAFYRNEQSELKEKYQHLIFTKTPIFLIYTVMYMPKFSFLTSVLNSRILHMFSSGIIIQIFRDIIGNEMKRREIFANNKKLPEKMSTQHFSGAFEILGGLIGVTGCVFLIEILSVRNRIAKKLLNILNRI